MNSLSGDCIDMGTSSIEYVGISDGSFGVYEW